MSFYKFTFVLVVTVFCFMQVLYHEIEEVHLDGFVELVEADSMVNNYQYIVPGHAIHDDIFGRHNLFFNLIDPNNTISEKRRNNLRTFHGAKGRSVYLSIGVTKYDFFPLLVRTNIILDKHEITLDDLRRMYLFAVPCGM